MDKGQYSLEKIALLLAPKVEHPYIVHLIPRNHEAADINALFGFQIEYIKCLGKKARKEFNLDRLFRLQVNTTIYVEWPS